MSQTTTKIVTLIIDGKEISAPEGSLLIEVAKGVGTQIPHFCYHPKLKSDANCRMCLVEIEKVPKLQTACTTPVKEGMVVHASSKNVLEARSGVMEFILSSHPLDCPICDQGGECHLQDLAHEYSGQYSRFQEDKRVFEKEYFGPIIEKEMNRCIQCMRCVRYCDEVIDSNALGGLDRGNMTQPGTFMRRELECEFCGGCIQICPVGALTSRVAMYDYRPWQLKKTDTICAHCADGCQMKLESRDEIVMRVTSEAGGGRNAGDLCAKGFFGYQFINHSQRLSEPLVKRPAGLESASWYEVIPEAASQLARIRGQEGGGAIAGIMTASCTNEDAYLFQKFMRLVLGSNHVDSTARLGHMNTVQAFCRVVGSPRMMNSYEDILAADLILLVGADVTETNPILGLKVKEAVRNREAQLVTISPFRENPGTYISHIVNRANQSLEIRVGSEGAAILGLIKAVIEAGCVDPALQKKAPDYLRNIHEKVQKLSDAQIHRVTGLGVRDFQDAVDALKNSQRTILIAGEGVVRGPGGSGDLANLLDLAIIMGKVDSPGCGVNVLGREANEQGVVEMGVAPEYLPGLMSFNDDGSRSRLSALWNEELNSQGDATLLEIIEGARSGKIKALYLVGVDLVSMFPESVGVREALGKLELLIYQDLFLTETAKLAHLVLPAASFAEKNGTFTNQEGRVQRVNQAIEPVGESRADWEIFSDISTHLQCPLEYADAREIFSEIVKAVPFYRKRGAQDYPKDQRKISLQRYLEGGYLELPVDRWSLREPERQEEYPFFLSLGSTLFHAGSMTLQSDALCKISPEGRLQIHPDDARALDIVNGQSLRLRSRYGTSEVAIKLNPKIPAGWVFYPEVFASTGVHELFPVQLDSLTLVPNSNRLIPVALERK